jgi:EAL domain-containing protein (putative c-di-GMP-specific phosphodiesterase class I)
MGDTRKSARSFGKSDSIDALGDGVLVQSITDRRQNLGSPLVAEGVDSEDTLKALITLGCDGGG